MSVLDGVYAGSWPVVCNEWAGICSIRKCLIKTRRIITVQDERGIYYYPVLGNKNIRMYVRPAGDEVEFRLWDSKNDEAWEQHGWLPWSAIQQAAELYRKEKSGGGPPLHLYDFDVAIRLIRDELSSSAAEDAGQVMKR